MQRERQLQLQPDAQEELVLGDSGVRGAAVRGLSGMAKKAGNPEICRCETTPHRGDGCTARA